jgi:hypothetical protein
MNQLTNREFGICGHVGDNSASVEKLFTYRNTGADLKISKSAETKSRLTTVLKC